MTKILLIEDETSLLNVYSEVLETEGYEVLKATDGEEGLRLAETEAWDLMFLDVMLPKLDGTELLRKLSQGGKLGDRPVVMLTNLDNDAVVNECLALGAVEHISKANNDPQTIIDVAIRYTNNS
jgi:CheY-like chemotaxis protein